ncbi:unnamed protein product [Arabidopsis lyrata]|nr:unnamed protein product [Arabidopsis lyrata]
MRKGNEEKNYREEEYLQLPLDLIVEILKKLPGKSLVIGSDASQSNCQRLSAAEEEETIESVVTRSLAQPGQQLPLLVFHHCVPETFFTVSSSFSQSLKPAVSVYGHDKYPFKYQYVRGLICCYSIFSKLVRIYNPTTRQSVGLPEIGAPETEFQKCNCLFGYDPVMDQYKVLSMVIDFRELTQTFHVYTLGQSQSWRRIQGIDDAMMGNFFQAPRGISTLVLLSFDIRSECFYHVWAPDTMLDAMSSSIVSHRTLLNYRGKLGCIGCTNKDTSTWVLENAKKQEWSKITFALPVDPLGRLKGCFDGFSGVTPAGEIFVTQYRYFFDKPLYVYYYDMNQNSFRRVEIQGTRLEKIPKYRYSIYVFAIHDHVENTMLLL